MKLTERLRAGLPETAPYSAHDTLLAEAADYIEKLASSLAEADVLLNVAKWVIAENMEATNRKWQQLREEQGW